MGLSRRRRWWRALITLLRPTGADTTPSAAQSSIVADAFEQAADETPNGIASTWRNAAGAALAGKSVTRTFAFRNVDVAASTVVANVPTIEDDGEDDSPIFVTVVDAETGAPIRGAEVVLSLVSGTGTLTQPTAVTDANGFTQGSLVSDTAGEVVVRATVAGANITQTATVTVTGDVTETVHLDLEWSTTGDDATALEDGQADESLPNPVVLNVVSGASYGYTPGNVLEIGMDGAEDGYLMKTDCVPASTDFWIAAVLKNTEAGLSLYSRHAGAMQAFPVPSTIQVGWGGRRPESGDVYRIPITPRDGTTSYPNTRMFSPQIPNGEFRVYLLRFVFLTATTCRIYPELRAFNPASPSFQGSTLADLTSWVANELSGTLQEFYDGGGVFSFSSAEAARDFFLGQEGNASAGTGTGALVVGRVKVTTGAEPVWT